MNNWGIGFTKDLRGVALLMLLATPCAFLSFVMQPPHLQAQPPSGEQSEEVLIGEQLGPLVVSQQGHPQSSETISLETLLREIQAGGVLLIDARSRTLYRRSHIPGALSIPWNDYNGAYDRSGLANRLLDSRKLPMIVVYCSGSACPDSKKVSDQLKELGHKPVLIYPGGLSEWETRGHNLDQIR